MILSVTTHRLWAVFLIAAGVTVFGFAKQISTLKSSAWARFYQRHPKAAERNPLSVHAGTERSIRVGAFMWRVIGAIVAFNGLIRIQCNRDITPTTRLPFSRHGGNSCRHRHILISFRVVSIHSQLLVWRARQLGRLLTYQAQGS